MRKIFIFFIFIFLCNISFCQSVGFISSEDDVVSYTNTDDFSNTFEINLAPLIKLKPGQKYIDFLASKCQAVRLNKNWFITAAHCVDPGCNKGCNFQARLIIGKNYEMDIISQSTLSSPQIFVHPERGTKKDISTYDIALIYFKPVNSKYVYKDPQTSQSLTKKEFMQRLNNYRTYKRALSSHNTPTLLIMDPLREKGPILARKFSVLSSFQGMKKVLRSKESAIYYPSTKTFLLGNFGIRQGISGSGLMTSKGELVGITSSISDKSSENDLAKFAAFDKATLDFIEDKIGSVEYTILK